ncbi:hypothetical protein ALC53_00507 [Atta colombica]|uniref:Uncharacterized protein n=1 Tax=Atta colombica TaxID=520822 RepID=A0A195BYF4_9HYME|nr:hypothetical protein ALC53_00507 [Atta colombica]
MVNSGSNSGTHICVVAVPACYFYRVYKDTDVSHSERMTTTTTATWPPSLTCEGRGVVRDDSSLSLSDIRANLLNFNPVMRPRRFICCNGRGIRVDPKDKGKQNSDVGIRLRKRTAPGARCKHIETGSLVS